ncbi:hypothetical protein [Microbulbifer taiwanensis]|uniref:hypothetical protein n=1 Tax=Microbulbifer taiwanensis TaxID=986746 RepID=UPI00360D8A8E
MFKSLFAFGLALLSGCTTVVIDEYRRSDGELAEGIQLSFSAGVTPVITKRNRI